MSKFYYGVKEGNMPGVYETWAECEKQVKGYPGAVYKKFSTYEEAYDFTNPNKVEKTNIKKSEKDNTSKIEKDNIVEKAELEENEALSYVDGSFDIDTKTYSYGVVFITKDGKKTYSGREDQEELAEMRNVSGELKAAMVAMEIALEEKKDRLYLHFDYTGIEQWALGNWKTNKEGTKSYKEFYDSIKDKLDVKFIKVKAHSGVEYNEEADKLAKEAIMEKNIEARGMKPVIGITTFDGSGKGYHRINTNYINAVFEAGGIPVTIPVIYDEKDYDDYLNILDGIIFSGGGDILPLFYNENPIKEVKEVARERDIYELGLFKRAYERKLPILGICRGMQIMNVALGGSLYQDIYAEIKDCLGHQPTGISVNDFYHSINIKKDTIFHEIFQCEEMSINSNHHQSVKDLGDNLIVSAVAEDGVIEVIEGVDERFLMGVQFHPEPLIKKHPEFLGIFKEFILAAKRK